MKQKRQYDTIVFDVDGTLIDTETANQLALQKMLADEVGRHYSLAELAAVCGIPGKRGLAMLGVDAVDELMDKWIENVRFWRDSIALYPGIEAVVETAARQGVTLGIVTSRTRNQLAAEPLVRPLVEQIPFVVCADDTAKHKPNPDPLLKFLEHSGKAAENALYIGDTVHDFNCARSAGVDFALASWGGQLAELDGAAHWLAQPSDIFPLLKGAGGQTAR